MRRRPRAAPLPSEAGTRAGRARFPRERASRAPPRAGRARPRRRRGAGCCERVNSLQPQRAISRSPSRGRSRSSAAARSGAGRGRRFCSQSATIALWARSAKPPSSLFVRALDVRVAPVRKRLRDRLGRALLLVVGLFGVDLVALGRHSSPRSSGRGRSRCRASASRPSRRRSADRRAAARPAPRPTTRRRCGRTGAGARIMPAIWTIGGFTRRRTLVEERMREGSPRRAGASANPPFTYISSSALAVLAGGGTGTK